MHKTITSITLASAIGKTLAMEYEDGGSLYLKWSDGSVTTVFTSVCDDDEVEIDTSTTEMSTRYYHSEMLQLDLITEAESKEILRCDRERKASEERNAELQKLAILKAKYPDA